MQEDMTNIAYTKEYMDERERISRYLFQESCYKEEKTEEIADDLTITCKDYYYQTTDPSVPFNLSGAECFLYQNGKQIYTYRALYSAYPYWLVSHQDGNRYFVFSRDLYGYSVLNLSTLKEYHFFRQNLSPKARHLFGSKAVIIQKTILWQWKGVTGHAHTVLCWWISQNPCRIHCKLTPMFTLRINTPMATATWISSARKAAICCCRLKQTQNRNRQKYLPYPGMYILPGLPEVNNAADKTQFLVPAPECCF